MKAADEGVEEAADTDEEDVVIVVVVDASEVLVLATFESLECLLRALCKTSPRPRAPTALSMSCLTFRFRRHR